MNPPISALPLRSIRSVGGFWGRHQKAFAGQGLISQWEKLVETGRIANFSNVPGGGVHQGYRFNDSDVYKWLEACAYSERLNPNPELRSMALEVMRTVADAQAEDGYLYTLAQLDKPHLKWASLAHSHEMYCMGHLIEAAIAWDQLGHGELMAVALRVVEHVRARFGPSEVPGYDGHPEFELAVYRLAAHLNRPELADWMDWMLDIRGVKPTPLELEFAEGKTLNATEFPAATALYLKRGEYSGEYAQDHLPIVDQRVAVGHAVRATYLFAAVAMSIARDSGARGERLLETMLANFEHLTETRMYITGGIGSSGENEGFSHDYDLPNLTAYSETCATIGLAMWARRMFEVTGDVVYIDVIERALFNGILSGVSPDTTHYFYDNPLESRGNHQREPWFGCACCPPNLARLVGSVSEYCLWSRENTLFIGIPLACEFEWNGVSVRIETDYPHSGLVKITLDSPKQTDFELALRIPAWATEMNTDFPGQTEEAEYEDGFSLFQVSLNGSRTLTVDLTMEPEILESHPEVLDNIGRVAISFGPTIYCLQTTDSAKPPQRFEMDLAEEIEVSADRTELGAAKLIVTGLQTDAGEASLYEPVGARETRVVKRILVPYREWADQGRAWMQVWIRGR